MLAILCKIMYNNTNDNERIFPMLNEIKELDKKYYMNTFGERLSVCFKSGDGMKLISTEDKVYYDFLGGIAVNSLGHNHPGFINDLKEQLDKVIHTSSLYYIENQAKLAEKLVQSTCADRVFFCNSGAEANEAAFKLAKIYFYKKGMDKTEIISLDHSLHGRTLTTVAATGQPAYQTPYKPLTPGFIQVEPNDFAALESKVTEKTAAIIMELIQGESGVNPMDEEYVRKVRKLCDDKGIFLIFDEVQTGMGRTGHLFAHQMYGVYPDMFTCAKALGAGVPIGALCASEEAASGFEPGDHGTTFGGNPFATAAGLSVFKILENEKLVENANKMGLFFKEKLIDLKNKHSDKIVDVRCAGLLIGIELREDIAKTVFTKLFEDGFLTSLCKGKTIRVAPPLIITKNDINLFVSELDIILSK